jgi:gamma-glutamyltranspeptidase / glutathione hydrolase
LAGKVMMGRSEVVATEHPLASLAGLRSFQEGGNAFDAATSASFVLSVVQPHLCGLGGDFFALLHEGSTGKVHCLNASGWAPSSFTTERMRQKGVRGVPTFGPASMVVPGYVKGVFEMHKRFGRLRFSESLKRAIELAEVGFPAGVGLVRALSRFETSLSPGAGKTFLPSGRVPSVGGLVSEKQLARTLRDISESGTDAFYRGAAAEGIEEEYAGAGFDPDDKDFSSYSPEWCEPLKMSYRGTDVFEVPPNSMGATTLLILRLLEESDLASLKPNSVERIKVMVEAAQLAYAARDREIGDPRFSPFDLGEFLHSGAGSAAQKKIDKADTTYFAIADREGNVLSCIQSIFHAFGSRVFIEKGGFFMNNRASAFRMEGPNMLEPRKRPLHTLSALILAKAGHPVCAMGASGGGYRPQQHALLATNVIDYGMELEEAVDYPRFLWDGAGEVNIEAGYRGVDGLRMRHQSVAYPGPTGVAQGVQVMDEALKGVCDVRGEGLPAGA